MLRTTDKTVPDRNHLTQRLRDVERTLANLTETAAKGGAVPAVLEALNRADGERRALLDELKRGSLKPVSEKGIAGTVRDLRRTLRGYLDDWHAMIQGNVTEARGLLNVVLRERITFTPIVGLDGNPAYELKIPIAFDPLRDRSVRDAVAPPRTSRRRRSQRRKRFPRSRRGRRVKPPVAVTTFSATAEVNTVEKASRPAG